jgi:NAD(P)-dependent dehydrogenase (short-subunit alcohol dehydrogenase family)
MAVYAGSKNAARAITEGLRQEAGANLRVTAISPGFVQTGLASSMTNAERSALPVMAPGRGEVIVAGAVILAEVMRRFGFGRTLVSETDILDALVFEMVGVR